MCLDNKLTYNPYFSPEYLSNNFIFDNATNSRNIMLYSDMNDFINAYIHYRSNAIIKKIRVLIFKFFIIFYFSIYCFSKSSFDIVAIPNF